MIIEEVNVSKNEQHNLNAIKEIEDDNGASYLYKVNVVNAQAELRNILILRFMNDGIKILLIIDGDQTSNKLIDDLDFINNRNIHVVRILSKGTTVGNKLYTFNDNVWLTILRSATNSKDATDTNITFLLAKLSSVLLSLKIKVIMISEDGFMIELWQLLQNEGVNTILVRDYNTSIPDLKTLIYN